MKKMIRVCMVLLISSFALSACQKKSEPIKKITLLYGKETKEQLESNANFKIDNVEECNRLLKEKGYPYELQIKKITYDKPLKLNRSIPEEWYYEQLEKMKTDKDPVDLILIASASGTNPSRKEAVNRDYVQPLTKYFESDAGKPLFTAYPKRIMDSLKVDKDYYYIPYDMYNINEDNTKHRYLTLNTDIAKRYGVDVSDWDGDLWKHKEELDKIAKASLHGNFVFSDFLYFFFDYHKQSTPLLGISNTESPYYINEDTGVIGNIYENENFQKNADLLQSYVKMGVLKDNSNGLDSFMTFGIETPYKHKKEISIKTYVNNISTQAIAMSSWTTQKNDVEKFLKIINTDKEISEALAFGKKDKDYFIINRKAYKIDDSEKQSNGAVYTGLGNPFVIPLSGWDIIHKDNKDLYASVDTYNLSQAFGFTFDDISVKQEMLQISNIYNDINRQDNEELITLLDYKTQIKKLNDAGMQNVLKEMNRQFQLYKNKT